MISLFLKDSSRIRKLDSADGFQLSDLDRLLWADLFRATPEERAWVEKMLNVHLISRKQAEEIEFSSRYSETDGSIISNIDFCVSNADSFIAEVATFIISPSDVLITLRQSDFYCFSTMGSAILKQNPTDWSGKKIFITLIENHIDHVADMVEIGARHISDLSGQISSSQDIDKAVIKRISQLQEQTMILRENIFDLQRVISGLRRSSRFPEAVRPHLRLMLDDVASLVSHTDFSFQRLDYLQDVALGLINIEQNEIVKIFSVAAVIFMPPTLVASFYGMNFRLMPELSWEYHLSNGAVIPLGYLFAIGLMILLTGLTIWFFKYKKWL